MAQDANQIAKEFERREQRSGHLQPPHPAAPEPRWGEFTILSSFSDDAYVLSRNPHVTVAVSPTGLVVLTHMDGAKTMFKPVEGWCMLFEPDDAEG